MVLTPLQIMCELVLKAGCSGLSYDLKFDNNKGEDDKIFIDNDIPT
jgi:Fe-S cluster assembly iron-binding protein IscA